MAMLDESNLLAMRARAAKFRTNHVGTKLNEAELHEFEALVEKREQTPSELIRGLVLGEIEHELPVDAPVSVVRASALPERKTTLLRIRSRVTRHPRMGAAQQPEVAVGNLLKTGD